MKHFEIRSATPELLLLSAQSGRFVPDGDYPESGYLAGPSDGYLQWFASFKLAKAYIGPMQASEFAQHILDSLAAAYGGHSQVPSQAYGQAILGQANNNGLIDPQLTAEELSRLVANRCKDTGETFEEVYADIATHYNLNRERLDWNRLPQLADGVDF